jgi:WD40 repeat protein
MYYLAQKEAKHKKGVRCCCVLQKSQRLVTGSCHGEIIIWNTTSPIGSSSSSTQTCAFQYTVEFEYSSFHLPVYALHDDTLNVFIQEEPFFFAAIDKTIHWLSISGKIHCLFQVFIIIPSVSLNVLLFFVFFRVIHLLFVLLLVLLKHLFLPQFMNQQVI